MRHHSGIRVVVFLAAILFFVGLPFINAMAAEMITWKQPYRNKTLSFEKGAKLPGMKPGEENVYVEWRWNTTGRKTKSFQPPVVALEELEELTKGHFGSKCFIPGRWARLRRDPTWSARDCMSPINVPCPTTPP